MKKILFLAVALFAFIPAVYAADTSAQPIYDNITKTSTIRCGYVNWPPAFIIDANTKQKSGLFYDIAEEMGKRLNLKIDWAEELGWGTMVEAVKTHRVDMICSALYPNSNRARQADFSAPVTYSLMYAWKGTASKKSYHSLADLDKPEVRFGYVDGTTPDKIMHRMFSHSTMLSNPDMTPISDLLEGVKVKKYDLMLIDEATANDFLKKNPGTVEKALPDPIAFFPGVMVLPAGETKLKSMIDTTLQEMVNDGTVSQLLEKNQQRQNYKIPAKPYQD